MPSSHCSSEFLPLRTAWITTAYQITAICYMNQMYLVIRKGVYHLSGFFQDYKPWVLLLK